MSRFVPSIFIPYLNSSTSNSSLATSISWDYTSTNKPKSTMSSNKYHTQTISSRYSEKSTNSSKAVSYPYRVSVCIDQKLTGETNSHASKTKFLDNPKSIYLCSFSWKNKKQIFQNMSTLAEKKIKLSPNRKLIHSSSRLFLPQRNYKKKESLIETSNHKTSF